MMSSMKLGFTTGYFGHTSESCSVGVHFQDA
jgi:hypothetical protein